MWKIVNNNYDEFLSSKADACIKNVEPRENLCKDMGSFKSYNFDVLIDVLYVGDYCGPNVLVYRSFDQEFFRNVENIVEARPVFLDTKWRCKLSNLSDVIHRELCQQPTIESFLDYLDSLDNTEMPIR
jgi:hypothetical protein